MIGRKIYAPGELRKGYECGIKDGKESKDPDFIRVSRQMDQPPVYPGP
jgi:hypothetical protein